MKGGMATMPLPTVWTNKQLKAWALSPKRTLRELEVLYKDGFKGTGEMTTGDIPDLLKRVAALNDSAPAVYNPSAHASPGQKSGAKVEAQDEPNIADQPIWLSANVLKPGMNLSIQGPYFGKVKEDLLVTFESGIGVTPTSISSSGRSLVVKVPDDIAEGPLVVRHGAQETKPARYTLAKETTKKPQPKGKQEGASEGVGLAEQIDNLLFVEKEEEEGV